MFFRFGAALVLVVLVALTGTALETQNLAMKRALSQQQYRLDVLVETQTALRLETQRLGAPAKLLESLQRGDGDLERGARPQRTDRRQSPLLNWTISPVTSVHRAKPNSPTSRSKSDVRSNANRKGRSQR